MVLRAHMTTHRDRDDEHLETPEAESSMAATRRRLITAGLLTPIVITVTSQPAWARRGYASRMPGYDTKKDKDKEKDKPRKPPRG
jgi:hypothetical protein